MIQKPPEPPSPNGESTRDGRGRFAKGNPGGPGNPLAQHASNMRRAAMDAIGPEHVTAILRKVAKRALEGDLKAARIVLDRVLGRPREEPEEGSPIDMQLPRLGTAMECTEAASTVVSALCRGQMNQGVARVMLEAIQVRARTLETSEFEQRLEQLEQAAQQAEARAENGRNQPDPRFQ